MKPPRWSETLLRLLLVDRDRDTISGDCSKSTEKARLPLMIGLAIGTVLGIMNLVDTARQPLAEDDGERCWRGSLGCSRCGVLPRLL